VLLRRLATILILSESVNMLPLRQGWGAKTEITAEKVISITVKNSATMG
jgi:hypothetical protein